MFQTILRGKYAFWKIHRSEYNSQVRRRTYDLQKISLRHNNTKIITLGVTMKPNLKSMLCLPQFSMFLIVAILPVITSFKEVQLY